MDMKNTIDHILMVSECIQDYLLDESLRINNLL